jgi:hypothetical protein
MLRYIGGSNVQPAHLHDAVRAHANTMVQICLADAPRIVFLLQSGERFATPLPSSRDGCGVESTPALVGCQVQDDDSVRSFLRRVSDEYHIFAAAS